MIVTKTWAMPNKHTFSIKPVRDLIARHMQGVSIDPFANISLLADVTNDIDPQYKTDKNMDALDFLGSFNSASIDTILFDPPYSPRQVSECYKSLGKTVNMETTQSSFWGKLKKEIARISADDSVVISCGWNSGGIGCTYGFEQIEILLVAHGGWHNDTIITVEKKVHSQNEMEF